MADDVNSSENSDKIEQNTEYNPQLDFFSEQFDPLLALSTQNISLPVKKVKKYDNLAAYKSAMDKEKNPNLFAKKKIIKESVPIERKWKEHQWGCKPPVLLVNSDGVTSVQRQSDKEVPIPSTRNKQQRNIFTKMERMKGPLSMLKKCVEEKLRIKIYTRNDREVRGYCEAFLVAFDKHFNMALEDVTEVWSRRKKQKKPAFDTVEPVKKSKFQKQFRPPEVKVTPHETDKKFENCSRYINQLMMRGEHVVLINIIDDRNNVKKVEDENKPEYKKEKFFDLFMRMESKIDINKTGISSDS